MIALVWILACGGSDLSELARDVLVEEGSTLPDCDLALFTEMATICRVGVALEAAASGDEDAAALACRAVRNDLWKNECHFRVAEELGRVGRAHLALRHCAVAGDFAGDCVTQTAWRYPRWDERVTVHIEGIEGVVEGFVGPKSERAPELLAAFEEAMKQSTSGLPDDVRAGAMDQLLSSAWYNIYYGSGVADPGLAKAATGRQAAPAHTAFALEAVRLVTTAGTLRFDEVVQEIHDVWSGEAPPPTGSPILRGSRQIRYSPAVRPRGTASMKRTGTWGGGERFVGESEAEDLDIALLEALFAIKDAPVRALVDFLSDPRQRVRWTAARLYAQRAGEDDSRVQALLESSEPVLTDLVWKSLVSGEEQPGWMAGVSQ